MGNRLWGLLLLLGWTGCATGTYARRPEESVEEYRTRTEAEARDADRTAAALRRFNDSVTPQRTRVDVTYRCVGGNCGY